MVNFIGRKEEISTLKKAYASTQSEFVAVYGRRRVGKTLLIRQVLSDKFCFQLTGLANTTTTQQLLNFHIVLNELTDNQYAEPPKNWLYAFSHLRKYLGQIKSERKVIFLDELPWFDTEGSDFMIGLEHFWNSYASARDDILLVVCGSSASWIINKLINNHGGLHNRVTERIWVQPFTLRETEILLTAKNPALDRYQIIQMYMVMGGIPFYLDAINTSQSAIQNIERLCFAEKGLLRIEFNNLFPSLFKNPDRHIAVVRAIATKSKGLTREDILKITGLSNGGTVSRIFDELEKSGFIRKYIPFEKKQRNSLYQLVDFYVLFYLRFIEPSNPFDTDIWINAIDLPAHRAWSGYAYEQICLYHVQNVKEALGISGVYTRTFSWRSSNKEEKVQIDLLLDRRDRVINLCEIKFTTQPYTISKSYAANLRNKIGVFKSETNTNKAVFLTFITTYGMKDNCYLHSLVQNDLTMDIFFE